MAAANLDALRIGTEDTDSTAPVSLAEGKQFHDDGTI